MWAGFVRRLWDCWGADKHLTETRGGPLSRHGRCGLRRTAVEAHFDQGQRAGCPPQAGVRPRRFLGRELALGPKRAPIPGARMRVSAIRRPTALAQVRRSRSFERSVAEGAWVRNGARGAHLMACETPGSSMSATAFVGRTGARASVCRCSTVRVKVAAALDVLASAHDARRHGSRCAVQSQCTARLKELGRCHAVVREVARNLMAP